ncbi:glutamate--cysteine ligase [Garciella nitratireducens DSM 15102]|uniref:Glutamate--cysteine ligase n=2 Tax=Garciella TaxID=218204 RepID=A0A1T4MA05_9FIRM|nr:glutamate--cysteine ligase [Garciella nitratireducens DSM 15102]
MVDYMKQIDIFVDYFKSQEKHPKDFKIGVEFEHFIVDKKTLKSINYYDKNGVKDTLKQLEALGWKGIYEGENILGLSNETQVITLEPGSQFEFSIKKPKREIREIEKEYITFLEEIIPILNKKDQYLVAMGYHPVSKIQDFNIIPKERYHYMYEYFKSKGSHAHNMMKGTAALQVAVDFSSQQDYIKKYRIISALSPVIYAIFDNSYYFEGEIWEKHNLRSFIWENTDKDRSGIVKETFDEDFGYAKYAQYILNTPPILIDTGEKVHYTGNKLVKDILNPDSYTQEELEHILTMVFPDVRTKKYIEIRMMDSLPYPFNLSVIAFWKGLLYHQKNLDLLYDKIQAIKVEEVNEAKKEIIEKGLYGTFRQKEIVEIGKILVDLAKQGLESYEIKYIYPLEKMIKNGKNPYLLTKEKATIGKEESIDWCILNHCIDKNINTSENKKI